MTGIVQKTRLTMNLSIARLYPLCIVAERGRSREGSVPVRALERYSVTTTLVRSVWLSRLTLKRVLHRLTLEVQRTCTSRSA